MAARRQRGKLPERKVRAPTSSERAEGRQEPSADERLPDWDEQPRQKDEQPPTKEDRRWRWVWALFRLRIQVTFSVLVGIAVAAISYFVHPLTFARSGDLAAYLTTLLGIASVLALVGSITFGFLVYYTQAIQTDKATLYSAFRAGVKDLRAFLDELHDEQTIDASYDYHFGLIDEITLKDFPLMSWGERVDPLTRVIEAQRGSLEEIGEFGRVLRGFAYRINTIEEAIQGLFKNFVAQVLVSRVAEPVLKAFGTLAAVMLVVILGPLVFDLIPRAAAWGIGTALACMTFALLLEMAITVRREMKEFEVTAHDTE